MVICDSEELPLDDSELAVVATDDTIFFHKDNSQAMRRLAAFDAAMEAANVPRSVEKDVDCADHLAGLGCELTSSPSEVNPERGKLRDVLWSCLGLDEIGKASTKVTHGLLGVSNRFSILSRPHFSCFGDACAFVRREPDDLPIKVPRTVVDEFILFSALAPLLTAGLSREWLPMIVATDAVPEFRFGTSVCPCSVEEAAELGRKAERRGDYVRLERDGGKEDEPERPRLGRPHRLGLTKGNFRDVLSLKAARPEHAGQASQARGDADRRQGRPLRGRKRADQRSRVPSYAALHQRSAACNQHAAAAGLRPE